MNVEEAIETALMFENRVVKVYEEAAKGTLDATGKRVFETLVLEEKGHVEYLRAKKAEFLASGHASPEGLSTVLPSRERIERGIRKPRELLSVEAKESEVQLLKRALDVEVEASRFYAAVVAELPPRDRGLFERFVQIEEGHKAIVQAEMDSVAGLGFWFDIQEFSLESG